MRIRGSTGMMEILTNSQAEERRAKVKKLNSDEMRALYMPIHEFANNLLDSNELWEYSIDKDYNCCKIWLGCYRETFSIIIPIEPAEDEGKFIIDCSGFREDRYVFETSQDVINYIKKHKGGG